MLKVETDSLVDSLMNILLREETGGPLKGLFVPEHLDG